MKAKQELLRALPKVDECVAWMTPEYEGTVPSRIIKESIQSLIDKVRQNILSEKDTERAPYSKEEWIDLFSTEIEQKMRPNFKRVINGTGVVIHTNLGRSLLPVDALNALSTVGGSYSNLEFDLSTGKRGSRYSLVEALVCELTGAEAALVVNNNAAAVLLVLDTLAKGTEVIVSRGQLVEIGGSFRIPDVMAKSGATLVEVGATNRTHRKDYEQAITDYTSMLLKVHTSNFRMVGFTSEVSGEELVQLARENNLVTMEDLGSGSLIDLSQYGLMKEPTVQEVVRTGIDVVTFSGDKLLGGPQAGIIVGSSEVIGKIKKNPLNRALRIDKFTLASLESVLRHYYDTNKALTHLPTLRMLTEEYAVIRQRAETVVSALRDELAHTCRVEVVEVNSRVGGGAMPECNLPSAAIALQSESFGASRLEEEFRRLDVPVIGRIEDDRFLLDARTIQDSEVEELTSKITTFFTVERDA